ncbi:IMP cyclohydrolase [Candidatus Woesearchaeota archaeon]|nr:IMP cyclohydrolase [Candidatus Woesearchaeota archaeon]
MTEKSRGTDVTDAKRAYRTVTEQVFPNELMIYFRKEGNLRYGENPNQGAAIYTFNNSPLAALTQVHMVKSGKGGLSATNLMDVTRALDILKYFDAPSVAVMKHAVPSGFATQHDGTSLDQLYILARDADARSAFGSIVVLNRPLDKATAEVLTSTFVEGVAAPEFEAGALAILDSKKDLRAIMYSNIDKLPKFVGDNAQGIYDIKVLPTGRVIVQSPYLTSIRGPSDLIFDAMVKKDDQLYFVERDPTENELRDMLTAWYVLLGVRSNGIVFVKDGVTVAVGSGQQERVGAVEQAILKAYQKAMDREGLRYDPLTFTSTLPLSTPPLGGAVMASDAFFPFRDSIDLAARVGVTAIIQPGGSARDYEVIQAVNEHKMSMALTLERCFGHF